jgi:hypothetical protein
MNVNSAETGLVENSRIIPYEALNFMTLVISSLYRKNKFNLFLNLYSIRAVNFAMHSVRNFVFLYCLECYVDRKVFHMKYLVSNAIHDSSFIQILLIFLENTTFYSYVK